MRSYSRPAKIGIALFLAIGGFFLPYRYMGHETGYSRHAKIAGDIQGINTQLRLYESMNGFYPTTEQGLQSLVTQPESDPEPERRYQLFNSKPMDPWQQDYIYRCPGIKNPDGYDLFSAGPDRRADTPDDDWGG